MQDLTLTVEKGEFVFLTGPSGAGKSTFLRLLLRQDTPSDGEIVVNGQSRLQPGSKVTITNDGGHQEKAPDRSEASKGDSARVGGER